MKIGRGRILANGLACRCPGCGGRTLFEKGRLLKVNASCPVCGLRIERGDGEFLGPLVINYGLTAFGIVVPVIVLYAAGRLGGAATLLIAFAASHLSIDAAFRAAVDIIEAVRTGRKRS